MGLDWRKSIVSVDQFTTESIAEIFQLADKAPRASHVLTGKILTNLFYEPSTRTSSSFHAAMSKLGGDVIPINEVHYSSVSKGETLEDTIRTLACYSDVIVLRHGSDDATERAVSVSEVPIINAGKGRGEHPTQPLLDLYSIYCEHGRLDNLTVTLMGDLKNGRPVHSLSKLLRMYDCKVQFVSPPSLSIPKKYLHPGDRIYNELGDAITSTDVLYITRVQEERFFRPLEVDVSYTVTSSDMRRAKNDMILLHPLPRVGEVPEEIDSDPRAAYFRQVKYGLYLRMALLLEILLLPEMLNRA